MSKKLGRRQIRTKKAITNAFMKLMVEKDIAKITIQEIADLADINRSTFYLHFIDIHDVLEYIEKETVTKIFTILKHFDFQKITFEPYPLLKAITDELNKYPEFNQFLIGSTASSKFTTKLKNKFKETLTKIYIKEVSPEKKYEIAFATSFLTAGVLECYEDWVIHNKPISLDELCTILSQQITHGTRHILN